MRAEVDDVVQRPAVMMGLIPMTDLELALDPDDAHVFVLPTFGSVRFPKTPRGEVVIAVPGEAEWRVSGGRPWLHPMWQAVEPDGRVVATLTRNDQRVVSGDRELALQYRRATLFKSPGPWVISEQGRTIASIPRRYWAAHKRIVFTILDERAVRADPRLTLFVAWSACTLSSAAGTL